MAQIQLSPNIIPTQGIILRISATFSGHYVYFPLPRIFISEVSPNLDSIFADSLAIAPYFPNITIFDSISSNILYQTYDSFPNLFHVYNLINRSHFEFSFPHLLTQVNAAIIIHDRTHFKVLIVCISEHPNPLFAEEGSSSAKPLVFYLYSSESNNWSLIPIDYAITSNHLLSNRRKPIHAGEGIVYLELTNRLLVRFGYKEEKVEVIPKHVPKWEKNSPNLDESTRYSECKGQLHCAVFDPIGNRVEIYVWMEPPVGSWVLIVIGKEGSCRGKVVGIHPNEESYVVLRSTLKDEVLIVDIVHDISWVVIEGRGAHCDPYCRLYGMNEVLEAATLGNIAMQRLNCTILHPHENIEGPQGEFFAVSLDGTELVLPSQNE